MASAYRISGRSYLARARYCLNEGRNESLFYAAFELRCGIESRIQEYLEAQDDISKKLKHGWEIAKLGKGLELAFGKTEKIIELTLIDPKNQSVVGVFYYTPVTKKLQKFAQQLGDLLHVQKKSLDPEDPWWHKTRQFLEGTYAELETATKGTCFGPPLLHRAKKTVSLKIEVPTLDEAEAIKSLLKLGTLNVLKVAHLERLPSKENIIPSNDSLEL